MAVYRVIYERFNGSSVVRQCSRVVRYCTMDEMRQFAAESYGSRGYKLVGVRAETTLELLWHRASRLAIRLARVVLGVAIAFVAYALLINAGPPMADVPLAQLTFGMIFSALFHGCLFLAFLSLGWWIAFGEGPSYAD